MVKQMQTHVVVVGLGIIALYWVVLIQIEGDYVFKTELSAFVHPHQFSIDCDWCASCGQSKDKGLSPRILLDDLLLDNVGHCK